MRKTRSKRSAAVAVAFALAVLAAGVAAWAAAGEPVTHVEAGTTREFQRHDPMGRRPVATRRRAAQASPAAWLDALTFRTYGRGNFGESSRSGSRFGGALATGDFNGDGRTDLVVGAPNDAAGGTDAGWFGVVLGGEGTYPTTVYANPGDQAAGQWGSVFAVGDFNADGKDDLAVGVPRRDFGSDQDSGTVWLFDGYSGGIGSLSRPIRDVGQAGALDGAALAVGDFNGDGVDDLVIGTPGLKVAGVSGAGQVSLLPGRPGAGPVTDGGLVFDRSAEDAPGDPGSGERLGAAVAAGDYNGDGFDDLAVGVPAATVDGQAGAGSVMLLSMGLDPDTGALAALSVEELSRASDGVPGDPVRSEGMGGGLAAGNFDGDSYEDLAIGVQGATVGGKARAGEIVPARGSDAGFDFSPWPPLGLGTWGISAAAGDEFGALMQAADVDGDGADDLLAGLPGRSVGTANSAGAVAVAFGGDAGPSDGVLIPAGRQGLGAPAHNRQALGAAVTVGDLNGDGAPDVAIGASGQTVDGVTEAGAVVIGWGPSTELPGVPTATPPPATATPTATATPLPRDTATPRPVFSFYIPYAARLAFLGRYPPVPPPE